MSKNQAAMKAFPPMPVDERRLTHVVAIYRAKRTGHELARLVWYEWPEMNAITPPMLEPKWQFPDASGNIRGA